MKAAVITLHSVYNYGTQLQAYATQKKLEQYFDEVEFVNYRRPDTYGKGLIDSYAQGSPIRLAAFLPTYHKWQKVFSNFQDKYLNIPKTAPEYSDTDVYFSGSDQVWNTGWNSGVIPEFYLSFAKNNIPKFAYASSFGLSELAEKDIPIVKEYLKTYRLISVREQSGLEIINQQLGLNNAEQLSDPTLAFDGDFWRQLKGKNKIKAPYVLIYSLNKNPALDKYASEIAKKLHCQLYRFCTRYDQVLKTGKPILVPKIEDFITYIDGARLVITDSFHATAFSANLNTDFACVFPQKYSSRLADFLKLIKAEHRQVKNLNDYSIIDTPIDFRSINKVLDAERKRYDDFLLRVLDEVKHEK